MRNYLKANGLRWLCYLLAGLLAWQTLRLHSEQRAHQVLQLVVANAAKDQAETGLKSERETGNRERQHAVDTQKASDEFTQKQPGRDAQLRADLDRAKRLQLDAERRAATYRAQAQANAAAGVDLADRLEAYDRHIVEGVEVVARLRGDLARRDDEVVLLSRQVQVERALGAE